MGATRRNTQVTKRTRAPLDSQAARYRSTRAAHADEIAEDYTEAIADLIDRDGSARVTDLAVCLGVSHVTVVRTLARLSRSGLVVVRPHRAITLTRRGRAVAAKSKHRHDMVLAFLVAIGVPLTQAEADAEGIEHHVSAATLRAIERFVNR